MSSNIDQPSAAPSSTTQPHFGVATWLIAAILIFAALYYANAIFAPVVCALFIIALVWPLQKRLQATMPKLLALAIVLLATIIVFLVFGSLISWGVGRVGRSLIAEADRFQAIYEQTATWLEGHGIIIAGLWAKNLDVRWLMRVLQGITTHLNTTVTFWLVVLIYLLLGLLEVDELTEKIRHYMLIRTAMSIATGAFVWALAAAAGLQFAKEWGVIAFALNFIPFIGPFIATMFPTLFSLAQFEWWQSAVLVFICLNIIQFVIGSYIEPRVAGRALAISPFLVLFSVFFWTYLWGFFGAFIGVPITIALLTLCAQHPSTVWVSDLFGAPVETPEG